MAKPGQKDMLNRCFNVHTQPPDDTEKFILHIYFADVKKAIFSRLLCQRKLER